MAAFLLSSRFIQIKGSNHSWANQYTQAAPRLSQTDMRQYIHHVSDPAIADLYQCFRISQGPLYHYTPMDAAASITESGQLWLTRADSFLDQEEVVYGSDLLRQAIAESVAGDLKEQLLKAIEFLGDLLRKCYVLSLSSNPSNSHLATNYGKAIIELQENFPINLAYSAWHISESNLYHFQMLYEAAEGYVVYDRAEQLQIARKAAFALQSLISPNAAEVDVFHMHHLLIKCIMLFKDASYSPEEEYRVVLHRLSNISAPAFDKKRHKEFREISYVEARVSAFTSDCLVAVHAWGAG